ncbi:glycoprotein N [Leporid alphaherpesvirus 4]|uniref:Glycoprotein N n=1 Tax=Leporid alphaherpesvirus 4 TaxID=481315 RepID=J9QWM7_9ALPH|nr:glycoprotein N [Leporid alphaherpesvirus 4]AFR32494.1 glycoprotein N [Leporid alphaherpesvirus 4]
MVVVRVTPGVGLLLWAIANFVGAALPAELAHGRNVFWEERCTPGPSYHSPVSVALLLFYLGLLSMGVSVTAHAYRVGYRMFCTRARLPSHRRESGSD